MADEKKVYVEMSLKGGRVYGFDFYLMPWPMFLHAVEEVMEENETATMTFTIRRYTQAEYDALELDQ